MKPADSFADRTANRSGYIISDAGLALFPEGSLPWLIYLINSATKSKFVALDTAIIVCSVVLERRGNPATRAALSEPSFRTFPDKT